MITFWEKFQNLPSNSRSQKLVEELSDVLEVVSEVSEKLYSGFLGWVWDRGERMIHSRKLEKAKTWKTWKKAAEKLDSIDGKEDWKKREPCKLYDYKLIKRRLKLLRRCRQEEDMEALVHHIRSGLIRGLGGSLNPELYQKCLVGTKQLILDYQTEVCNCLKAIVASPNYSPEAKLSFFADGRYAYGKTALMLSGGGGLGIYHLGVTKTLYEQNLLPRIICGTSAGSFVAAMMATTPYKEIPKWFQRGYIRYGLFSGLEKGSIYRKIKRFLSRGYLMDIKILENFVRDNLGDITFKEAFDKTGIVLNITVSESSEYTDYRLLNYLTAPHVLIWSAALASSAIPYVFEPVELKCKNHKGEIVPYHPPGLKFIDGSIKADLPMQRLSEQFNVNAFIVSQTNAYAVPFMTPEDGGGQLGETIHFRAYRKIKRLLLIELRTRVQQLNLLGWCQRLTRVLNIFTQEYRGTVTVWPIPSIKDYLNILQNPSDEDIQRCISKGMHRTFPKMNMLNSILLIEKCFEDCYLQLCEEMEPTKRTMTIYG